MSTPSWAMEAPKPSPSTTSTAAAAPASAAAATSNASTGTSTTAKTCVGMFFLIVNLGLCVLMAYTGTYRISTLYCITTDHRLGAEGIALATSINDTANVFVGLYMILFATILFTYECIQLCPCAYLDTVYKKNFGFLYGTFTKAAYMLL